MLDEMEWKKLPKMSKYWHRRWNLPHASNVARLGPEQQRKSIWLGSVTRHEQGRVRAGCGNLGVVERQGGPGRVAAYRGLWAAENDAYVVQAWPAKPTLWQCKAAPVLSLQTSVQPCSSMLLSPVGHLVHTQTHHEEVQQCWAKPRPPHSGWA